ncbi:MAG: class I SAM-dependent methyltransferase [Opitutaceae bacterium]|nr:class I SAM-dependent methyltransferase [Opitutaceae bacterium]
MPAHIDEPGRDQRVDPLCFLVRGWVWLGEPQTKIAGIEAWSGGTFLGETAALYERPDVTGAHSLPSPSRTGFEIFAHDPGVAPGAEFPLHIFARLHDGTRTAPLAEASAVSIPRDYRLNHFGVLLEQHTTAIQGRGNVFAEGPSLAEGSGEVAMLIRRYLGPPPRRVIDVGCGLGSYGRGLIADGYNWLGAEIDAADCAELVRLGLPHRHIDGCTLPFADASFDAALCLEVLEHLPDPRVFLREVQRVAPHQLIVSVPNCELLGYLWDHLATPWHMLEADHKNFFTRWSLGSLLREYYSHVELRFHTPYSLRTIEGTPLHYHLFAVATRR